MKFDKDLCLNFDLKKLLWQDELNPRVRCAFGNVSNSTTTLVLGAGLYVRASFFIFIVDIGEQLDVLQLPLLRLLQH